MSIEAKSLSSPLSNRERLKTQTRSKLSRVEISYQSSRASQGEGGFLSGCLEQWELSSPPVFFPDHLGK